MRHVDGLCGIRTAGTRPADAPSSALPAGSPSRLPRALAEFYCQVLVPDLLAYLMWYSQPSCQVKSSRARVSGGLPLM